MYIKMIILSSESEFREKLNSNLRTISKIMVFEDALDRKIYFYCYTHDDIVYATKESSEKNFKKFKKYYKYLSKKLHFRIFPNSKYLISMKL